MHITLRESRTGAPPPGGLEGSALRSSDWPDELCRLHHGQPPSRPRMRAFARFTCRWTASEIAILKNGEAITHELPAGPHRLRAHNTLFWKTHDVVLQPGEHARFKAVNRAGWATFGFLMVLGAAPLQPDVRARRALTRTRRGGPPVAP